LLLGSCSLELCFDWWKLSRAPDESPRFAAARKQKESRGVSSGDPLPRMKSKIISTMKMPRARKILRLSVRNVNDVEDMTI
jgi:hypothetical protein